MTTLAATPITQEFDVAKSDATLLYDALDQLDKKEVKTITVVRAVLGREFTEEPQDAKEVITGNLVAAFTHWIVRSERRTKTAVADKALGEYTEKEYFHKEMSKFRQTVGREFSQQFEGYKIGFKQKSKGKGGKADRYEIKLVTPKTPQTVAEWLKAGIAVYGSSDVFASVMDNADIKLVIDAINTNIDD